MRDSAEVRGASTLFDDLVSFCSVGRGVDKACETANREGEEDL